MPHTHLVHISIPSIIIAFKDISLSTVFASQLTFPTSAVIVVCIIIGGIVVVVVQIFVILNIFHVVGDTG